MNIQALFNKEQHLIYLEIQVELLTPMDSRLGVRHSSSKERPNMIKFYFSGAPNPMKVALFLEEAGLEYEPIAIDTRKGDQFDADFTSLNPNNKVPVIVDEEVTVFDSNAILLYLGEKTGKFMPPSDDISRGQLLSWLMFVATGVGPYSGQCVHFRHFAPEPDEYASERYIFEAKRHYGILNDHLTSKTHMIAETYTIVDMAVWGWARMIPFVLGEAYWAEVPNLKRLIDEIEAKPAAKSALSIKDRFNFKGEMDEEARRNMFRHMKL